jgi:hypothetical protein
MTTTTIGYTINELRDDHNRVNRISAVDAHGREICGAFAPQGHEYWSLFVTKTVTNFTGLSTPPHREHFWSDSGRITARAWIELIAALYVAAQQNRRAA